MRVKFFIHLCCDERCVKDEMDKLWRFMQHYPDTVRAATGNRILTPFMTHVFISTKLGADPAIERLQGYQICGWDSCGSPYPTKVGEFLDSRIRQ